MTDTTEEKSYCMKCDVLVHRPSGVAYTGVPSYDRFIGSPAILFGEKRDSLSATLGTEGLILTWTENKRTKREEIPYLSISEIGISRRKKSEILGYSELAAATLGAGLLGLALASVEYFGEFSTLTVQTGIRKLEIWLTEPNAWAAEIQSRTSAIKPLCPSCSREIASDFSICPYCGYKLRPSCPSCGREVKPDFTLCPSCGTKLKSISAIGKDKQEVK